MVQEQAHLFLLYLPLICVYKVILGIILRNMKISDTDLGKNLNVLIF